MNTIIKPAAGRRNNSHGWLVLKLVTKESPSPNKEPISPVATIDQIGAEALYSVDPEFFRKSKQEYRLRRDTVISGLRKIPGVVVEEPMGAFYVMASLPVDDADKFQHWLLETFDDDGDTVMFAPGAPFYETPGKGINEVRIAYVLNREDLNRAMEVLIRVVVVDCSP